MKVIKNILYTVLVGGAMTLASCNDYLDKLPDNRVELQTPDQLLLALVDGYSTGNYAKYCELSGDNIIDNNSPSDTGVRYNLEAYDVIDDEMFAWEDAKSDIDTDSPSSIWEGAYHSIAVANHVLAKIEEWRKEGREFTETDEEKLAAAEAEAYLIRAYNHFVLVNVFAMPYGKTSETDLGVPYATKPETEVLVQYERETVADNYRHIEEDLLKGLPNINDSYYDQPKYHFNKRAANAFAARFYLFKREYDKVVDYADAVLGTTESSASALMRDYWATNYSNADANIQAYISAQSSSNLMLVATNSSFWRTIGTGTRYGVNRDAATETIYGWGPTWSSTGYILHPCYIGKLYINGKQDYGVYFLKLGECFEYTDKVAGIGYVHIVRTEFTAEETLLCRAEAKIYMGDYAGAVSDLKVWDDARKNLPATYSFSTLTDALVRSYYDEASHQTPTSEYDPRPGLFKKLNIEQICDVPADHPEWALTDAKMPYIQCLMHFRRIETIFDGYRWFDIKRYGIEVTHKIGRDRVETLTINDPRRALQLPAEVISAGLPGNNRTPLADGATSSQKIPFSGSYSVPTK